MGLDLKKPLFTREGKPVRILATDVKGYRQYMTTPGAADQAMGVPSRQVRELRSDLVIGLILNADGAEETKRWTPEGFDVSEDKKYDLVQPKVKKWKWAYHPYASTGSIWISTVHLSEEEAKKHGQRLIGRILETEIEE